ncbi:MAG: radical SAM protein [Clostridium sp.]|uniref:radical SAM protein n=1 Tax=Clostridium sp. TaxID=1506 RepID=UPI0039E977BB
MYDLKNELKKKLYDELKIKNKVSVEGVNFNTEIFKNLDLGGIYQEQIHGQSESDHETHVGIEFPCGYNTPNGFRIGLKWDRKSQYKIEYDGSRYFLTDRGHEIFPIEFFKRPKYYNLHTSDGVEMSHVGNFTQSGTVHVTYSNECSLKDQGQDCLFCNVNATKDVYGEKENHKWKYPKQIAETVKAAYDEGVANHLNLTGGFIAERREVDYYIDVAEAVKEYTGLKDFNGTAVIGAPLDLEVIEHYKEVGYRTIAINIEVWDKNLFKAICPGKDIQCGGWENWVKAIEYAREVFGFGRARTGIVAGLEPKNATLEGVEYFVSKGIPVLTGAWNPNPGSGLEGHRTPEPEWHWDMAKKTFDIYRKYGITFEHIADSAPSSDFLVADFYKIENGLLPVFNKFKLEGAIK